MEGSFVNERFEDKELILVVVHGVHGLIDRGPISSSAWRKMSLEKRLMCATGVTIADAEIRLYRDVIGKFLDNGTFCVEACASIEMFPAEEVLKICKGNKLIFAQLSTAVWLKTKLDLVVSQVLGCVTIPAKLVGLPAPDYSAILSRVCEELKEFMVGDQVLIAHGIQDFINPLGEVNAFFKDGRVLEIPQKLSDVVDDARSLMNRINLDYNNVVSSVQGIMVSLFPDIAASAFEYAILFVDFIYAFVQKSVYLILSCVMRMLLKIGVLESVVREVLAYIQSLNVFTPKEVGEGEFYDAHGATDSFGVVLAAVVGTILLRKMPGPSKIRDVSEMMRCFNLFIPTLSNVSELFSGVGNYLPTVVTSWWSVICPAGVWEKILEDEFPTFLQDCDDLLQVRNELKIRFDVTLQAKLTDLRIQARKYAELGANSREVSGKLFTLLMRVTKKLDDFQAIVDAAAEGRECRPEPYCIGIVGGTDIGKSHFVKALAAILAPSNWNRNNLVYSRTAGLEFWDGYTGEFATVYDDFGQVVESGDFAELFSVVNNVPYIPPMASLDNPRVGIKGTHFSSQLVVLTSNSHFPPCANEIRTPAALERRRRALWEVRPIPKYCIPGTDRIDWARANEFPGVFENYEHLSWRECRAVSSQTGVNYITPSWITTKAMVTITRCRFNEHMVREQKGKEAYDSRAFIDSMRCELDPPNVILPLEVDAHGLQEILSRATGTCIGNTLAANLPAIRDQVLSYYNQWKVTNPYIYDCFIQLSKWVGILGACTLVATFWKSAMAPKTEAHGSSYDFASKVRKPRIKHRVAQPIAHGLMGAPSMCMDMNDEMGVQQMRDLIAPAMLKADVFGLATEDVGCINRMCVFAIGYDLLLCPRHIFLDVNGDLVQDDSLIVLTSRSGVIYKSLFLVRNMVTLQGFDGPRDVCVYKFGPRLFGFRDRINLFVEDEDLAGVAGKRGLMVTMRQGVTEFHNLARITELKKEITYKLPNSTKQIVMTQGWEYTAPAVVGDCGALIGILDKTMQRRLIGIHIAGITARAYGAAQVVTGKMLREAKAHFGNLVQGLPLPSGNVLEDSFPRMIEAHGNFEILGTLARKEQIRLPDKTSIIATPLLDSLGPHLTEPAVLSPDDPRLIERVSPLALGIAKYGVQSNPFNWTYLLDIVMDMFQEFEDFDYFILNEHQAINGIIGREYFDALNMTSSAGFPFKLYMKPGESKRALFVGDVPEAAISDPLLRSRVDFREEQAKKGNRVPSAWVDCLKDEKRSLDRVMVGNTRVFAIAPLDFVILMRKYCLAFAAKLYSARFTTFSAVGINCMSMEWDLMANYLLENSDLGFAGDFSRFDGTLSADCMQACCDLINMCYGDEFSGIRQVLFNELIHTVHIAMDCVYLASGGNPSGNPLTVVVNTLVNEMYLRYAWLHLAPPELANLPCYHEFVRTKIYGDDNLVSVKKQALEFYNMHTVRDFLGTMGIKYGVADKSESQGNAFDPIVNLTFLKHSFVRIPEVLNSAWFGAIEWKTIIELLYWSHKNLVMEEALCVNSNTALRFAFFHGQVRFESFAKALRQAFRSVDLPCPSLFSWRELRKEFLSNSGFTSDWKVQGDRLMCQIQGDQQLVPDVNLGIALAEQTPPTVEVANRGSMLTVAQDAHASMNDVAWGLKEMVGRWNLVESFVWSASDGDQALLLKHLIMPNLLTTNTISIPFERFTFWRGSVKLRFQVNGTRFHAGRLVCYFVPLTYSETIDTWHEANKAAQTSVQHIFLDPSVSTIAELNIPFVNYKNYINLTSGDAINIDHLGYVVVQVFNPLLPATGASTQLNVSLWVSLPDSEFHVPTTNPITSGVFSEKFKKEQEDLVAHGNSVSSKVTNIIHRCVDVSLPNEVVGDKFDIKSNVSGMDKVNISVQPEYRVLKPFGYMNHATNLEFLNRLTLMPSSQNLVDPEHFGTDRDEMQFKYLFSLPTFLQKISWSSGDVGNTILAAGMLGPGGMGSYGVTPFNAVAGPGVFWMPTLMEYAALPFTFWRGGLRVRFDIVATAFHVGRLWFGVHFGDYSGSGPAGISEAYSSYGAALDLGPEAHSYSFEIPFLSSTTYKKMCNGTQSNLSTSELFKNFLGTWTLRVLNPLIVTSGVASSIEINMFFCGADDFEVAGLHLTNLSWCPIQAQGAQDLVDAPTMAQTQSGLGIQTMPQSASRPNHFGERYNSVREVIKRYTMVRTINTYNPINNPTTDTGTQGILFMGYLDPSVLMMRGTLGWYAQMFRVWRGSLRMKITWYNGNPMSDIVPIDFHPIVVWDPDIDSFGFSSDTVKASLTWSATTQYLTYPPTLGSYTVYPKYQSSDFSWCTDADEVPDMFSPITIANTLPSMRSPPVDISRTSVPYQEFELPFTTQYNILATNVDLQTIRTSRNAAFLASPGALWVGVRALPGIATNSQSTWYADVYMAAGDDFRFGLLLGPHRLQLNYLTDGGTGVSSFVFDNYTSV